MVPALETIQAWVWGVPLIILLLLTGLNYTVPLRGLQFRRLWHALWLALVKRREPDGEGDISHFQALMTALAATVGTGNIVGVATRIRCSHHNHCRLGVRNMPSCAGNVRSTNGARRLTASKRSGRGCRD